MSSVAPDVPSEGKEVIIAAIFEGNIRIICNDFQMEKEEREGTTLAEVKKSMELMMAQFNSFRLDYSVTERKNRELCIAREAADSYTVVSFSQVESPLLDNPTVAERE